MKKFLIYHIEFVIIAFVYFFYPFLPIMDKNLFLITISLLINFLYIFYYLVSFKRQNIMMVIMLSLIGIMFSFITLLVLNKFLYSISPDKFPIVVTLISVLFMLFYLFMSLIKLFINLQESNKIIRSSLGVLGLILLTFIIINIIFSYGYYLLFTQTRIYHIGETLEKNLKKDYDNTSNEEIMEILKTDNLYANTDFSKVNAADLRKMLDTYNLLGIKSYIDDPIKMFYFSSLLQTSSTISDPLFSKLVGITQSNNSFSLLNLLHLWISKLVDVLFIGGLTTWFFNLISIKPKKHL